MKDNKNFETVEGEEIKNEETRGEQNPEKVAKFSRLGCAWRWIKEHKGKVIVTGATIIGGLLVLTYAIAKSAVSGDTSEDLNAEGIDTSDSGNDFSDSQLTESNE